MIDFNFENNDQISVLLLNGKRHGAGLNLQFATDLVTMHETGSQIRKQMLGRINRIGRTTIANIWDLRYNSEE